MKCCRSRIFPQFVDQPQQMVEAFQFRVALPADQPISSATAKECCQQRIELNPSASSGGNVEKMPMLMAMF